MIYLESTWTSKPLSEVTKRVTGVTYKKSQSSEEYVEGFIPLLKANNIENNQILFDDFVFVPPDLVKEEKIIQKNDILIAASSGSLSVVGKAAQIKRDWDGSFGAFCKVLRPDTNKVDPRYLSYFFHTGYYRSVISHLAKGANINNINNSHFDELFVPLPPLETQKKIAAVLDKADALCQKRRETIDKLDELTQSVFLDMFGDPKINPKGIDIGNLGDYARIEMGQSPKGSTYNEEGKGIPLLNGPTEFGLKYPTEKQWTTEPKKFAERDDILFCVRGATAGRLNRANKKYCIGRGLAAIKGKEELETEFIYYVLESFYEHFQSKGQGSTFINISKSDLKKLEIPIPDQIEQEKFVKIAAHIEENKSKFLKAESKLDNLFNSLLQKAFKGELNFSDTEEQLLAAEENEEYVV